MTLEAPTASISARENTIHQKTPKISNSLLIHCFSVFSCAILSCLHIFALVKMLTISLHLHKGKIKGDLDRIKGLGQLEEADLKATMFSTTGGQKMEQIVYSEKAIEQLCSLMGEDVEPRKEFVMSRIDFSKYNNS